MSESKTLVLFDVDGTLTTARQEVKPEMRDILQNKLKTKVSIWLKNESFLSRKIVHEDKDCKLILTLINIERTRPSDFFFGVHSLFRMLAPTAITKLPFSTKTW